MCSRSNKNLEVLIFETRAKPGKEPTTNPTHQRRRRRRDLNLERWEASAVTTEPPVFPLHLPLPLSVLNIVSSQTVQSIQSTNCLSSYSKRTQQLPTLLGQQC